MHHLCDAHPLSVLSPARCLAYCPSFIYPWFLLRSHHSCGCLITAPSHFHKIKQKDEVSKKERTRTKSNIHHHAHNHHFSNLSTQQRSNFFPPASFSAVLFVIPPQDRYPYFSKRNPLTSEAPHNRLISWFYSQLFCIFFYSLLFSSFLALFFSLETSRSKRTCRVAVHGGRLSRATNSP